MSTKLTGIRKTTEVRMYSDTENVEVTITDKVMMRFNGVNHYMRALRVKVELQEMGFRVELETV